MDQKFLVKLISEFDISYKDFRIIIKNQINRNYGHFYWFICSIYLFINLINILNLLFISDEDEEGLKKIGSLGFNIGGKDCRFMLDLAALSFFSLTLILLSNYFSDKMQWLLKMSSIYEEIRNKQSDRFLMNSAKRLSLYFKWGSILAKVLAVITFFVVLYSTRYNLFDYPIGFIIFSLTSIFVAKIGFPLMIRQFIIIIFFCRMHCFLFKRVNKDFTQLSKKYFKTCLSIHYKLCESLEELQTFLRPMFVLITMI